MNNPSTILVINPGSTSTKLALSVDESITVAESIVHPAEKLATFTSVWNQYPYRLSECRRWFANHGTALSAIVARGGLLKPVEGGVYAVNEAMLRDAENNIQGEHVANLGCRLAAELAKEFACPAFVVDPVSVDEFESLARYSGHPAIIRRSLSHALNIHAVARRAASDLNIPLPNSKFVIAHLGGGISIAPVRGGRIIDVNDAASDGPFSPERTGGLPLQQFISLCFSGTYTEPAMRAMVMGKGGLVAYLGTNSVTEVERRIKTGDTKAQEVHEAMAYQIAKEIGAMSTVLQGDVDAILMTGGIAHSEGLTSLVRERVESIAPVKIYPGEDEMQALAGSAYRVLKGIEQLKEY